MWAEIDRLKDDCDHEKALRKDLEAQGKGLLEEKMKFEAEKYLQRSEMTTKWQKILSDATTAHENEIKALKAQHAVSANPTVPTTVTTIAPTTAHAMDSQALSMERIEHEKTKQEARNLYERAEIEVADREAIIAQQKARIEQLQFQASNSLKQEDGCLAMAIKIAQLEAHINVCPNRSESEIQFHYSQQIGAIMRAADSHHRGIMGDAENIMNDLNSRLSTENYERIKAQKRVAELEKKVSDLEQNKEWAEVFKAVDDALGAKTVSTEQTVKANSADTTTEKDTENILSSMKAELETLKGHEGETKKLWTKALQYYGGEDRFFGGKERNLEQFIMISGQKQYRLQSRMQKAVDVLGGEEEFFGGGDHSLEQFIRKSTSKIIALEKNVEKLTDDISKTYTLEHDLTMYKEKFEEGCATNAKLRGEKEGLEETQQNLVEKLSGLSQKLAETEARLRKREEEVVHLDLNHKLFKTTMKELRRKNSDLEKKNEELQDNLKLSKTKSADLTHENGILKATLEEKNEIIKDQERTIKALFAQGCVTPQLDNEETATKGAKIVDTVLSEPIRPLPKLAQYRALLPPAITTTSPKAPEVQAPVPAPQYPTVAATSSTERWFDLALPVLLWAAVGVVWGQ